MLRFREVFLLVKHARLVLGKFFLLYRRLCGW